MKRKIKLKDISGNNIKEYELIELTDTHVKVTDPEIGGVFTFSLSTIVKEQGKG